MGTVDRPSKAEWALGVARAVATRGECLRRRVGCVIVAPDGSIVATGYNGNFPGGPSCLYGKCPRGLSSVPTGAGAVSSSYDTGPGSCIALHAEQNGLLRADWNRLPGASMYITCEPCGGCRKMISGTPIEWVIWAGEFNTEWYKNPEGAYDYDSVDHLWLG